MADTDLIERATKAIDLFDAICNIHDPSVSAHDRRVRAMAKALEASLQPDNPAQGVTRPVSVQAAFETFAEKPDTGPHATAMFRYIERLEAAIGASGQAVAWQPRRTATIREKFPKASEWLWAIYTTKEEADRVSGESRPLYTHPVQPGWRDMESAPREHGHMILAPNRYGVVDTVCWSDAANDGKGGWDDGFYGDDLPPYDPEIWMPVPVLPAAPQPKGE